MKNPFQYGGIVQEDAFCNRTSEIQELIRVIENSGKAFVYSERRFGKTSLVKLALSRLPHKETIPVYIDLWPTDSEAVFVTTVAKAIVETVSSSVDKALETAKNLFSRLTPSVTLDCIEAIKLVLS